MSSSRSGSTLPVDLALLAGLLAGVSLLPKAKNYAAVVAAVAMLGALAADRGHDRTPRAAAGRCGSRWAPACSRPSLAVSALLLDAGVITPPAPRPKYDQYGSTGSTGQYGQYGGQPGYYGQQRPAPGPSGTPQSGYGTQYGGYPSQGPTQADPTTGGFSAQPGPQQSSAAVAAAGSPTPPTGFPSFSPPPSSGSGGPGQGNSSDHGGSAHGQHSFGSGQQPQAPSSPSGPSQS